MDKVRELSAKKENIELRIRELSLEHEQMGVGLKDSLIDANGFPRADVDIYRARQIRSELSTLHYDHKECMRVLESALSSAFSNVARRAEFPTATTRHVPFALVDQVMTGSPADMAGLQVGDLIVSFGPVNSTNHGGLKAIAELVAASQNTPLDVLVERTSNGRSNSMSFSLTPASWSGRGLLGCHLAPI